jgi:hypothetical protein
MIQKRKRKELYDKFRQGAVPSGADFADSIRSQLNLLDDGIDISDDPKEPIGLRAHGEEENILDFSDISGKKRWRISGRNEDGSKEGLNIQADENSKLYVERESGNIGICTDRPEAKLHIKQTGSTDAFRVDDEGNDTTPFIISSDGNVGIGVGTGSNQPLAKLHISKAGAGDVFRVDDTTQDTTPFIIADSGNVGVGYDDPAATMAIKGGLSIGDNRDPGSNNLFVKGNIEVEGNIVLTGDAGSGIQIDGPIRATSKDFYIEDNVFIVSDPAQPGAVGNLNVEGDSTLGTYGRDNVVVINGKMRSGNNQQNEQYVLEINDSLKVDRNYLSRNVTVDSPLNVTGLSTLNTLRLHQGWTANEISTDNRLSDNSDSAIPTEKAVKEYIDNLLIGSVAAFAMSAPPEGWLECNGIQISRITYARLFNRIGVIYGAGDGANYFNLPDLRNQFIRGHYPGNRAVGSMQSDDLSSHNHTFSGSYTSLSNSHSHVINSGSYQGAMTGYRWGHSGWGGFYWDAYWSDFLRYNYGSRSWSESHNHSFTPAGYINYSNTGSETRPRNIALMYCIKF